MGHFTDIGKWLDASGSNEMGQCVSRTAQDSRNRRYRHPVLKEFSNVLFSSAEHRDSKGAFRSTDLLALHSRFYETLLCSGH